MIKRDSRSCYPPIQAVKKDYGAVKAAIGNLLDVENYDDGSYGR